MSSTLFTALSRYIANTSENGINAVKPNVTPVTVNFEDNGTTNNIDIHSTIAIAYVGTKNGENTADTMFDILLKKKIYIIIVYNYFMSSEKGMTDF